MHARVDHDTFGQEKEVSLLPSFDSVATELLSDERIKELPGEEQGRVIVDRFIGAVVRHGEVTGSQMTYSPLDVIRGIDKLSTVGEKGMREITSTDGLRTAVYELVTDERVGKEVGDFASRLGIDDTGRYILTSPAQIEGYLVSGGQENQVSDAVGGVHMEMDTWMPVLMEHTKNMATNPHLGWMSYDRARELTTSSAPLIQNTGRDWAKALRSAEKVGVDVDLLQRSAERIQARSVQTHHDMGATALFVATERRIQGYKQDLKRRSYGA